MSAAIAACAPTWAVRHPGGRPQTRRCRCRHRARQPPPVQAGLLDLLRGGGAPSTSLAEDAEGAALRRWMEERGLPPQKLAAVVVPGAGRGLAATQPLSKGEPLLFIPAQLVITPAMAAQLSCLAPLLEAYPLPSWSVLALWLAEGRAAGPSGEWWQYVSLLPEATGCVLEWNEEEVGWLAGSQLAEAAAEIRGAADASWAEMQPLLAEAQNRGLGPPGAFSRAALQWAFGILLSRLVRLASLAPAGQEPAAAAAAAGAQQQEQQAGAGAGAGAGKDPPGTEALLPFADLLNHSPSCAAFLDWSEGDAAVVLRTDQRYRPGEEVHISYGAKTGGELLLSYGFCPRPAENPHDGCKLRLALRSDDPAAGWKAAALEPHGFAPSQLFPLKMAAAPFELVHYAALAAAEVGSQEEAAELARRLLQQGEIPPGLQRAALESVVAACQAALKGYPHSFDEDRAELDALERAEEAAAAAGAGAGVAPAAPAAPAAGAAGQQPLRRRQVLQALVYERQVLSRTLFVLQQELKDLKRMSARR